MVLKKLSKTPPAPTSKVPAVLIVKTPVGPKLPKDDCKVTGAAMSVSYTHLTLPTTPYV